MNKRCIINFADIIKICFNGNEKLIKSVQDYFCELSKDEQECDIIINFDGYIEEKIEISGKAEDMKCFCGANYFVWKEKEEHIAYAHRNQRSGGSHLVRRNENIFNIKIHNEENEEIAIRVAREIIIKKLTRLGYIPIHASAIVKNGEGHIFFGEKSHGKSTSMFFSVINNFSLPLASDVAFIKKVEGEWQVIGFPVKATIDESFFKLINYNIKNTKTLDNKKVSYYPYSFCQEFNTKWKWRAKLKDITRVKLVPEKMPILSKLDEIQALQELNKFGREEWWKWDDVFDFGVSEPNFDYQELTRDIPIYMLTGDLLQHYKEKEGEISERDI